MHYNFIEIGTSDFYTCIEQASETDVGISVEPISYYLNRLPNKPRVKKLNCAISKNNLDEYLEVFYIPEESISKHNLPDFLRGCNAVGDYHKQHVWQNITHLTVRESIQAIPISKLFIDNDVTSCDLLKLDTEGSDSDIMLHLIEFLKDKDKTLYPKRIKFESNVLTPEDKVRTALEAYLNIGYRIEYFDYPCDESTIIFG